MKFDISKPSNVGNYIVNIKISNVYIFIKSYFHNLILIDPNWVANLLLINSMGTQLVIPTHVSYLI